MKRLPKLGRLPTLHLGLLVLSLLLFFAVSSSPLLGTLGFESANLLVTCLGPFLCVLAALNQKTGFASIFRRESAWLLVTILFYSGLLFVNGFYLMSCSLGAGVLPFLIIAIPPLLLNVSIGAGIAALLNSGIAKIFIVIVGYAAYYIAIAFSWWHEASFRVFTHASFLMSSDLLQGDQLTPAVVGYRTSTLLLALAIILFGINFLSPKGHAIFEKKLRPSVMSLGVIGALFIAHVAIDVESYKAIGKNRSDLEHEYKLLAEHGNLRVFADPLKTSVHNAKLVLKEARFYQEKIEKRLGTLSRAPIIIWLHATDDDKFLYTGAKNVHFALPKHREIHISGYGFPHNVLGHELAHIDVGDFSDTILGLPGSNWLIPNMALTEGIAMALTKELYLEHGLTLLEQARSLYQGDLRVNLDELFSDNPILFAKTNPRIAYIYAGAMIDFLLKGFSLSEQRDKLQNLIRTGLIAGIFPDEQRFAHAHRAFFAELNKPIGVDAISWAQRSFSLSSILLADCTEHGRQEKMRLRVAAVNQDINEYAIALTHLSVHDQRVLTDSAIGMALTALQFPFALGLIAIRSSLGVEENHANIEALAFKKLDALVGINDLKAAKHVLDHISASYFLPSERRLLVVLSAFFHDYMEANEQKSLSKAAVRFLFSRPSETYKLADFSYYFGHDHAAKGPRNLELDLLAQYILARLYMHQGQYVDAKRLIGELVQNKEYLPDLVERETRFMSAKTNMHLGDHVAAMATLNQLLETNVSEGEKLEITDMIERIKFDLKPN